MNGTSWTQPKHRDTAAGDLLFELRTKRGLSPEQVPQAMRDAEIDVRSIPCSRTIRRIEDFGAVPVVRIRFGLAAFYGRELETIWRLQPPSKRRRPRARAAV